MKLLKKILVRMRKVDKKYQTKESSYGEIDTYMLSAFIIVDQYNDIADSNFIVYQEADNKNIESINELDSLAELLSTLNIRYIRIHNDEQVAIIISASIDEYNKLSEVYKATYTLAYHKHLKHLLNYLTDYKIINSNDPVNERFTSSLPIDLKIYNNITAFIMSNINGNYWNNIMDKFTITPMQILSLISVYCDLSELGIADQPLVLCNGIDFLYNYTFKWDKDIVNELNNLIPLVPDDFKIPVLGNKNIFDINLFSNPSYESSLYEDIDEIIN